MKFMHQTILRLLTVILMTAGFFGGNNCAYALSGNGTEDNPYKIGSTEDWDAFADLVNSGTNESACAILTSDIDISKGVGGGYRDNNNLSIIYRYYRGTFDGKGHIITLWNFTVNQNSSAPFIRTTNATIKNLRVKGTLTIPHRDGKTSDEQYKFAAGIAGYSYGSTIQNCISSITIDSRINGDGSHGGIVGWESNTTIENCVFDGRLLGSSTYNCGGFIGSGSGNNSSIKNCIFDPAEITFNDSGCATFSRSTNINLSNCYYKTPFGTVQGTDARDNSVYTPAYLVNQLGDQWVEHANDLYLKPFDRYVDITGWVSGKTANAPVLVGNRSSNGMRYSYLDATSPWVYSEPLSPGHYRVEAYANAGVNTETGDTWPEWNSIMYFCVVTAPTAATGLAYDKADHNLITTAGSAVVGTFYYKLGADGEWSTNFPTATNAGDYKVYYYVKGDATHNDIRDDSNYYVDVTIAPKEVTPENITIEIPATLTYTGSALTPAVTVKDVDGTVIDPSEYTVTYSNNVDVGDSPVTVTITDNTGGNYTVNGTATFTILKAAPTYTAPKAKDLTYNMNVQELITVGSTSHGTFYYSTDGTNFTTSTTGLVGTDAKQYPVYYKLIGDANHTDVGNGTDEPYIYLPVTIKPKPVESPEIILSSEIYYYDGTAKQPTVTVRDGGTVIPTSEYTVEYKDNISAGTATVILKDNPDGNYAVSGTATFTIVPQQPGVTPPTPMSNLIYNTAQQNLVMAGNVVGGTMEYSLDNKNYSTKIPTGTDAGQYEVYYRVKGDENHSDRDPVSLKVTISSKTVSSPVITLSATSFIYNGEEQRPDVTVKDGEVLVPASEYTVDYSNNINVGTAMVIIMDKKDGNYIVNGTTSFTILAANAGVTPPEAKTNLVYNGTAQQLITAGSVEGGTMDYSLDRISYSTEIPTGVDAKDYKVYYRVKGDINHGDETDGSLTVTISPKTMDNPDIILEPASFIFDGTEKKPAVTVKDGEAEVPASEYTVTYSDNTNVGTGLVTLTDNEGGNYTVSGMAEFSIVAAVTGVTFPEVKTGLVYNRTAQELVTPGSAVGGTMEYSLNNKKYSTKIPTGTDAKQYTVYFRVVGDDNHVSMEPMSLIATINSKALTDPTIELNPSQFAYDGKEKKPKVTVKDGEDVVPASEYTVSYSDNIAIGTATVTITDNSGGNYIVSAMTTFQIYDPNTGFVAPVAISGLVYNGKAQELVVPGVAVNGVMKYSLNNKDFSTVIPTGTDAGSYKVYYKVVNESSGVDTNSGFLTVSISEKSVVLSVTLTGAPESVPSIKVTDAEGNLMPSDSYIVVITTAIGTPVTPVGNRLEAGDYVLTVKPTGNYTGPTVSMSFHVRRAYSFVFTMKSDLIGVCLPYNRDVPNGYHVYYFDRVGEDGYPVFKRILAEKLIGGEPYLLKYVGSSSARERTRGSSTIDLTPSNLGLIDMSIPIKSQTNQNMVFTGTFDDMTVTKALSEGAYLLQADNTWRPLDSSMASYGDAICLEAFQTYLRFKDRTTPYPYMTVTMVAANGDNPDPPSSINALILEDEDGHLEWYDMQGRRIEAPQRGVNILRTEDGKMKKVLVRDKR